jgi:hypothetical protein
MIEEIIKEVKERQKEINELKKDLHKKSEEAFFKGAKQIIDSCPELKSVSWNQYTPYFNDGDETIFSANTDYLKVNGDYAEEDDSLRPAIVVNNGTWNREKRVYEGRVEQPNPNYNKTLADAVDKMSEFLGIFDDSFYKSQFGDHVTVTITSDGVDTEDYEHE